MQIFFGSLLTNRPSFQGYHEYIDENLPPESPYLYGLHPNAEIGFLTVTSEKLFLTVLEMQPKETDSGAGTGVSHEEKAGPLQALPSTEQGQDLGAGSHSAEPGHLPGSHTVLPWPWNCKPEGGKDPQAGHQDPGVPGLDPRQKQLQCLGPGCAAGGTPGQW